MNVHLSVLKLAEAWQKSIIADLTRRYPKASLTALNQTSFRIIAIVLCLYLCERRQLIQVRSLQALPDYPNAYNRLIRLWQTLSLRFGNRFAMVDLSPQFVLADSLTQEMIHSLYQAVQSSELESSELAVTILGQVYETVVVASALNLAQRRKTGGIYYTPKPIVQYMVQSTIDQTNLSLPTILDPACGGGAFLIEAYQHLLDRYCCHSVTATHTPKLSLAERQSVLNCLHGVDIDAQAIGITRLSLWLKLCENIDRIELETISQVNINVHCGDALISPGSDENISACAPLDWQTTFPQVLAAGGFDIVIGNPPYVDAETMTVHLPDCRWYCTLHYQTATGNWDLFCVFIEKALQLCRVGGITSLIVPNKLFSAQYASAARSLLLQNSYLLSIRDYSSIPVFGASVYPIVYIAQKHSSISCEYTCDQAYGQTYKQTYKQTYEQAQSSALAKTTATVYEQMRTVEQIERSYTVRLQSSMAKATQPWSIGIQVHSELMQRLDQLPKLGEIAQVMGAATVAEAYLLQSLIQNNASPAMQDLQLVNSGTIDRYQLLWGQKPLRYLGQTYSHPIISAAKLAHLPPKRLAQAQHPKIIVAGMAQRLECALDGWGRVLAGKSTVVIQSRQVKEGTIELCYLLGLLNSRLLSFYLINRFSGNRLQGGYFRMGPPQLRELPILLPDFQRSNELNQYERMIDLAHKLHSLKAIYGYRFGKTYQISENNINKQLKDMLAEVKAIDTEIDLLTSDLYQLSEAETAAVNELIYD